VQIYKIEIGIEQRGDTSNFGHWEMDTVVGKNHQGGIITAVEKKASQRGRRKNNPNVSRVTKEEYKDNGI